MDFIFTDSVFLQAAIQGGPTASTTTIQRFDPYKPLTLLRSQMEVCHQRQHASQNQHCDNLASSTISHTPCTFVVGFMIPATHPLFISYSFPD